MNDVLSHKFGPSKFKLSSSKQRQNDYTLTWFKLVFTANVTMELDCELYGKARKDVSKSLEGNIGIYTRSVVL